MRGAPDWPEQDENAPCAEQAVVSLQKQAEQGKGEVENFLDRQGPLHAQHVVQPAGMAHQHVRQRAGPTMPSLCNAAFAGKATKKCKAARK